MADRATFGFDNYETAAQAAPQTFRLDTDPLASEMPVYKTANGGAVGLTPLIRRNAGDFCDPLTDFPPEHPFFITDGAADVSNVHPGALSSTNPSNAYRYAESGVLIIMDGVEVIQPKYNLIDVQRYLLGNAWHYSAVKAKATAATELGYEWVYDRKSQPGILSEATKALSAFEERIYARNHKDLATLLREQAIDFFSTGNKTIEIAYTMGGKVDCLYSVPAVTVFRHPVYPIAVQALPEWSSWSTLIPFDNQRTGAGLQIRAVMPLFMSGWSRDTILQHFPDVNPELVFNNEMVHVANSVISTDPFYGVADILPALAAMFGDNAANDYNWQFFENNAVPRYAVTISGGRVDKKVTKMIIDFFNEEIQGRNHRTVVIPLPRDMQANFQALDATPNEASFINFKKLNREEIAAVHSIPPSEIGLWENANKANSQQQAKNYFLKVIRPCQAKDEAMMNRILKHGLGLSDVRFRFKNVEYTDDQERATAQMTKAQGFKNYMDGISNALKTIQMLANGQATGGSGGGASGWGNRQQSTSSGSGSSSSSGSSSGGSAPAQVTQTPLLTKEEAKKYVKQLMEQIESAPAIFELEDTLAGNYD